MQILQQVGDTTPRALAREQIRRFIAKRRFQRGDQLPTYAEFCAMLGFSLLTIQRAMGDLAKEGLVYRLHGKGSYVGRLDRSGSKTLSRVGLIHNASLNYLIEAPYLNLMLSGILRACSARQIDLTILSMRDRRGQGSIDDVVSQVDGMLLIGVVNRAYVQSLLRTKLPMVLVDSRIDGVQIDSVVVDNRAAVEAELRSLLALGHRRIAYVSGLTPDPITDRAIESSDQIERRDAYRAMMSAAGLADCIRVIDPGRQPGAGLANAAALEVLGAMRSPDPPTALLAFSAMQAVNLTRELSAAGFAVPDTVSLAAVAGVPADVAGCDIALDYGRVDFRAMGMAAIETLERRCMPRPPKEPQLIRIGVERSRGRSIVSPSMAAGQLP